MARTVAQQVATNVEQATAPFQYTLSTRAGCECVSRVVQALCEANPNTTIVSVDGVSAYDTKSREAMMQGLLDMEGGETVLPFVRQFYGRVSQYLWEDDAGVTHSIQENLWVHSSIRIGGGKTQVWNGAGSKPDICEVLDRVAQAADPEAKVWKGSEVPPNQQGLKILGAPFGHQECIAAQLERSFQKQETLIQRIPLVPDFQAAWLILLHCASARANYLLRVVDPAQVLQYTQMHDQRLWLCLCHLLGTAPDLCDAAARSTATLPLVLGGLGVRSAVRTRAAGFWASCADCLPMIEARHPEVAARIIAQLEGEPSGHSVWHAAQAAHGLAGVHGFEPPSWRTLAAGLRPPHDQEDSSTKAGWQHEASSRIEQEHRESLFRVLADSERALLISQGCSGAGAALQTRPTCPLTRIDPALFRVLLLRRLRLPLPLSIRSCRSGRPLDSRGHHRAACARAGVMGRRGFAVESAAARVCREGGARVTTNVMVRDMDLAAPSPGDAPRLEIVADGLPLFGGAQLVSWPERSPAMNLAFCVKECSRPGDRGGRRSCHVQPPKLSRGLCWSCALQ